jgi:hypothetical protein
MAVVRTAPHLEGHEQRHPDTNRTENISRDKHKKTNGRAALGLLITSCARSRASTAVYLNSVVFWVITLRGLVSHRRFGPIFKGHATSRNVHRATAVQDDNQLWTAKAKCAWSCTSSPHTPLTMWC